MEINTQQMEALLHLQEQQAQLPRKQSAPAQDFENILARQMDQAAPQASVDTTPGVMTNLYTQAMHDITEKPETQDPDTAVLEAAFEQASGALDLWDSYTQTLGTSTTDTALRDAWGLLEGIDAKVAQMRNDPVSARSSTLDAILNELEILSATEKFKFNRGDYIS